MHHRRGTATWAQRHRSRLDRIYGVRDPWNGDHGYHEWTDCEVNAWEAAAEHLRAQGLYGRWQTPESVRQVRRRRACLCNRERDAA